jgi:Mg2+ transporter MgtE
MIYLSQILGKPVVDASGETIGEISDLGIATGEVFPRVTSVAFMGKERRAFMLSWRKYVQEINADRLKLNRNKEDLRFSLLQPGELLVQRDLLDHQIVDTQGLKVVRVADLKLAESGPGLRLIGAEVGLRGLLRRLNLEKIFDTITKLFRYKHPERLIAWSYMELLEKDMSELKLGISHKRLHELHPADIADIITQMKPEQRTKVFKYLDDARAADTISETTPEVQASLVKSLDNKRASDILETMDPDDAADIIAGLPYEKAGALLNLMGVKEAADIRKLLGYKEKTAGGIMTTDFLTFSENLTAGEIIESLRKKETEAETIYYIYVVDDEKHLKGVVSLRNLILKPLNTKVYEIMSTDLITVKVDDDQEDVADIITKYNLLAVPVVDEDKKLLGIVTVDDAMEVMEEEEAEDIFLITGSASNLMSLAASSAMAILRRASWLFLWLVVGVAAGAVMKSFTGVLGTVIGLTLFVPLIIFLSNDISTHFVTAIVRTEEAEKIGGQQIWQKLLADFIVGIITGFLAGFIIYFLTPLWHLSPNLNLIIGISIALTVFLASIASTVLQIIIIRYKFEPKISLNPFITILTVIIALTIYMSIATLLR